MSIIIFEKIQDFISYKEKCFLCDSNLHLEFSSIAKETKISSSFKDNYLNLHFKNNRVAYSDMKISVANNEVVFSDTAKISMTEVLFYNIFPTIDMVCSVCGNFSYSSAVLNISNCKVDPFKLSWESFVFDKFWIQNNIEEDKTKIYSTENVEFEPIITNLIPFDSRSQDKLLQRIKTIINFS